MLPTWTAIVTCCFCAEHFILHRVSMIELTTAVALFRCPHCHRIPTPNNPHEVVDLSMANLPFRKGAHSDAWHYSEYCSEWPADNFIEIDFPPVGEMCNECKALVGT